MRSIRGTISVVALLLSAQVGAAPSVTLDAPATGVRYVAPASIELAASPTVDVGRTVERVEFLADGEVIGTAIAAPYTFTWIGVPKGNYNLRARVIDNRGRRDASPVTTVRVRNNTAPKVRLSVPEHRYIAPGSVPLSATVTDRDDPIAKVEFFSGDTLLATSTAEPYAFDWTGVTAGDYGVTARATDALGAVGISNIFRVRVRDNAAPHVRILAPGNNASFPVPASIQISIRANDRDDNLTNLELFANGASLAVFTGPAPYEFNWTDVTPGTYALTARATDNLGLSTTSRTVTVTVTGQPAPTELKVYFIHVDHLNTPRLIADDLQRTVWRWDQAEPFGNNAPDENPSGLGMFEFPDRLPGQSFDKETNLHYNYFRDYDPATGTYKQSDPIGLRGGLNTYAYGNSTPLVSGDPDGLEVRLMCRVLAGSLGRFSANVYGQPQKHCFVYVSCPEENWSYVLSLFMDPVLVTGSPTKGTPLKPQQGDDPNSESVVNNLLIKPRIKCTPCQFERSILDRFDALPSTLPYALTSMNSNSFARSLVTSSFFGTAVPANSITNAPAFNAPSAPSLNR
jgi:RHS repeat-associated protein